MWSTSKPARVLVGLRVLLGATVVGAVPGGAQHRGCGSAEEGLVAGATGYAEVGNTVVPGVAGLVAGATGYEHPTSWPPCAGSAHSDGT